MCQSCQRPCVGTCRCTVSGSTSAHSIMHGRNSLIERSGAEGYRVRRRRTKLPGVPSSVSMRREKAGRGRSAAESYAVRAELAGIAHMRRIRERQLRVSRRTIDPIDCSYRSAYIGGYSPGNTAFSFSGTGAIMASVVIISPAIDAAFCRATRTTFAGSMIPLSTRSVNCSV